MVSPWRGSSIFFRQCERLSDVFGPLLDSVLVWLFSALLTTRNAGSETRQKRNMEVDLSA